MYSDLVAVSNRPPTPYCNSTAQSLSLEMLSYAFSRSTKHALTSFTYFHDFSKDLLQGKDLVHCASARTKPRCASISLGSTVSRHFFFKAFGINFTWNTGEKYAPITGAFSLVSLFPFLWIGFITLVCHCFGACPLTNTSQPMNTIHVHCCNWVCNR